MDETQHLIQIKGIRDGLLVTLGEAAWDELVSALLKSVEEQASFFQGARVALHVGGNELRVAELSALRDQLSEHGIALWAVISESPQTETTAQYLGLATRISKPRPIVPREPVDEPSPGGTKWVEGPLRSGGRVQYDGNVVVYGDINPGAEIIAGGNVIIWGRLRGVVHAGSQGNDKAIVCALELNPTQLRIADKIAVSPKRQGKIHPEVAMIKEGQIVADTWQELTGR